MAEIVGAEETQILVQGEDAEHLVETEEVIHLVAAEMPIGGISGDGDAEFSIGTIVAEEQCIVAAIEEAIALIAMGEQGPPGQPGASGGAALFITDIQASGGIAGQKQYAPDTVPAQAVLTGCAVDVATIRVWIEAGGGATGYLPTITVNGVSATLAETDTKRCFPATLRTRK